MIQPMLTSPRLPVAILAIATLGACNGESTPVQPTLTAAARARLDQFRSPSTWQRLDADAFGERLRDPRTGIVFRSIPAGSFAMGDDAVADPSQKPQHRVTLTRGYLLAETELTVGQWRQCRDEFALDVTVPVPDGDDALPMPVSCRDAEQFAALFGYRLPSEAEWERACSGGVQRGQEPWATEAGMREYAWFHRNSGMQAHAVASRKANAYGLFDMLGNLWEWCGDDFDPFAYQKHGDPATDPKGTQKTGHRVIRGGSWFSTPPATPRTRLSGGLAERSPFFGVRFACDVPE